MAMELSHSSPRMILRWPARLALILAALVGWGALCAVEAQAPPPAVGVRAAEIRGVARAYEFIGRIGAINTVQLRARVEGFLDKILFKEGQEVTAGDLLYQIEQAPYQAQVDQAKAKLASDQAQVVNAELQYRRSAELAQHQNAPQSQADKDKATMDSAQAAVMQDQAALELTEVNLSYTQIHAPIDGRIGRTAYTQGNLVNPASGVLATIVSQDPIYTIFPVSQRQLEDIRAERHQENGSQVKIEILVRLANGKEYPHPGVWNFTDVQVNQQTDTLIMRATLPNPERQLVDGEFVTVVVKERNEQPRLVVAQAAVQLDQAGSYVLVVDADKKVEIRRITTGAQDGTDVVVTEGLKAGEQVIVDGIQKVRPGQAVAASVLPAGKGS
ncbi:MAG TPA: efflux RND transporter periplasmic adaptor subunit [Stellaceae bacterium]|nr:efflux RND transporter periplasmic adaptor subunit [Stellaceae bacterium]